MQSIIVLLIVLAVASALRSGMPRTSFKKSMKLNAKDSFVVVDLKTRGTPLKEYIVEQQNGAKAISRTYGGNVYSYVTKDGIEVFGRRADAKSPEADDGAYAGGVPHIFPQYGPGPLKQHGFLRDSPFIQEERAKKLSFDRMIFKFVDTPETLAQWPNKFEYRYDITVRDNDLEWEIILINFDTKPWSATLGLHNYFDISSLKNVVVSGPFKGATVVNRVTGAESIAPSDDITITEATDNLYKGVKGPITITDTGKGTKVTLTRTGYEDTVIWNPYGDASKGFDKFLCVQPVQATPVTIPVGQFIETHFSQKVRADKI